MILMAFSFYLVLRLIFVTSLLYLQKLFAF